jgi:hypothetical protein
VGKFPGINFIQKILSAKQGELFLMDLWPLAATG